MGAKGHGRDPQVRGVPSPARCLLRRLRHLDRSGRPHRHRSRRPRQRLADGARCRPTVRPGRALRPRHPPDPPSRHPRTDDLDGEGADQGRHQQVGRHQGGPQDQGPRSPPPQQRRLMNVELTRNEPRDRLPKPDLPITSVTASACTIPTDAPEADGTLTWDSTTLVLVHARAGEAVGTGWTYAPAAAVGVVEQLLAPAVCGTAALAPGAAQERMSRAVRTAGRTGPVALPLSPDAVAPWSRASRLHDTLHGR